MNSELNLTSVQDLEKKIAQLTQERDNAQKIIQLQKARDNSGAGGYLLLDKKGHILTANQKATAALKTPMEELCGQAFFQLPCFQTNPQQLHLHWFQQAQKNANIPPYIMQGEILNGHSFQFQFSCKPICQNGVSIGFEARLLDQDPNFSISKLIESRNLLHRLTANLPGMVFQCINDDQWTMVYASKGCSALTGYQPEDLLYNQNIAYFNLIIPEDRKRIAQEVKEKLRPNNHYTLHYAIKTEQGKIKHVREKAIGIYDDSGQLMYLEGFITDVTHQHQIKQHLIQSEKKYREIVENAHSAILKLDLNGHFIFINEYAEELFGYKNSEIIGSPLLNTIVPEKENQALIDYLRTEVRTTKNTNYSLTSSCRNKAGNQFWIQWTLKPVCSPAGKRRGYIAIGIDITNQKKTETKLGQLDKAITQSPVSVVITNQQGNIEYINPKFSEITGYQESEVIGENPRFLKSGHQSPDFYENMWNTLNSGKIWRGEFLNKRKDGSLFWEQASISPILENGQITHYIGVKEDITPYRAIQQKLKEREAHYRKLYMQLPAGVQSLDKNGCLLEVNPYWLQMTGYQSDEVLGKYFGDFLAPEDAIKFKQAFAHFCEIGYTSNTLFSFRKKDDSYITIRFDGHIIYDQESNMQRTLCIGYDITEQKQTEKELRQLKEFNENMIQSMNEGILVENPDGLIEFTNPALCRMLGYEKETLLGQHWTFIIPEELHEKAHSVIEERGKNTRTSYELELLHQNGRRIPVLIAVSPHLINKSTQGLLVVITNISPLSRTRKHLQRSKELFRSLAESSKDYICRFDKNYLLTYVNQATLNALGEPMNNLLGHGLMANESNREHQQLWRAEIQAVFDIGQSRQVQMEMKHTGGTRIIDWQLSSEYNNKGVIVSVMGVGRDITQIKGYQQELIEAKEKAEESDRLKTAFLANMSHEIRTPMNAILGFSELLKDDSLDDESRVQYLDIINSRGKDLLKIISDIIDISRIESGNFPVIKQIFSVTELVEELQMHLQEAIKIGEKPNLQIIKINPDLQSPLFVNSDKSQIIQVFKNLFQNAVKFTHQGSIHFGFKLEEAFIRFFVKDSGIGIAPEKQKIIFKRFRQADDSHTREFGGTGLGLAISKNIAKLLGGGIFVESAPGKGSNFSFTIPLNMDTPPKIISTEKSPPQTKQELKGKTILIAEDEVANYLFLDTLLSKRKAKILWAQDGQQVVEMAKDNPHIDAILMDIRMPVRNGLEATKLIREFMPNIPIIAQTANALSDDRQKVLDAGCSDYISKPINIKKLLAILLK